MSLGNAYVMDESEAEGSPGPRAQTGGGRTHPGQTGSGAWTHRHVVQWLSEKVTLGQSFLQPYFPNLLFYDSELLSKKQRRAHSLWVTLEREEFMLSCHYLFQS